MQYKDRVLRHELKYYINYYEFISLRTRLRQIIPMDKYSVSEDGYHIRSLYFDNSLDRALHEKNWGVRRRDKYRIRIYNHSDQRIKLERKSKFGQYISKDSLNLSREDYKKIMNGHLKFLKSKNNKLAQDFYYKYTSEKMEPKIIVDYLREAYDYEFGGVRITFDKHLMAGVNTFDIFEPKLVTVHALPSKIMILEVKYNQFIPTHIRNMLQLDSHHRSAISKYVICREEGMHYYKV